MDRIFPVSLFRAWMSGSRETAERIREHDFSWLGIHKKFGREIDWNFGAKQDIKLPWELSRFQFLPNLCRAYEIHHDEKYALEAKDLIRDWILKNPAGSGIHWKVAMEAAIRACNWITAWFFLRDANLWRDAHFEKIFLSSLQEHGDFIEKNLEFRKRGNTNHLIADFAGLFFLGLLFPDCRKSKYWLHIGKTGLETEMKEQVYEDGVNYEGSIPYHRFVCEMFGYCALLAKENSIQFSSDFMNRLEKMFEFAALCAKPNGLAPQIGDGDDGRLFILEDFFASNPQDYSKDHRRLFKLASELFPSHGVKLESKGFEKAGVYIMRKNDFYCLIESSPNGQNGNGGHAHNDTLSFELSVDGEDFIVDPGTYCYTADARMRKHFRSTRMHNTVMIDDKEMNRFRWFTLFSMKNDAIPKVNDWKSDEKHDFLDAEHSGYKRLRNPVTHRRTFRFDKNKMELHITDFLRGKGAHALEWNFHFGSGVTVSLSNRDAAILKKNGAELILKFPHRLHVEIRDDLVSPSYGIKENAKVLTLKIDSRIYENPFCFTIFSA